jgi:hypothetical protein
MSKAIYKPINMKNRVSTLTLCIYLTACSIPIDSKNEPAKTMVNAVSSRRVSIGAGNASAFDRTLSSQGVTFRITSPNDGSINTLRIQPSGLKADNTLIERQIEGTVTNAEVADLNVDGSPELYVYVTSAGSGSHGSLVAYAANNGKSLSEIYLPPMEEDKAAAKGYMGHDEFAVVENTLVRRFPVYKDGDTNSQPTGGTRQIQYKLKAGEAGWILRPDKTVNY